MAEEGRWRELAEYCMQDARLTHELCSMERVRLPGLPQLALDPAGRGTVVFVGSML